MQAEELAFAAACTAAEGWFSEDLTFLQGLYRHDPAGCLLAELNGEPLGVCVATPYVENGFIGELIVLPHGRGAGIGATLLQTAMKHLQERGARTIYLDGVLKAVGLYERNGFRKICRSIRFSGTLPGKQHPNVRPMQVDDLPAVLSLDRQAFGDERGFFLKRRFELFPELCQVMLDGEKLSGFILGKRGTNWVSAGPWVVTEDAQHPIRLLESLAAQTADLPVSLGVLETNHSALSLLRASGFIEHPDSPWRMALGVSSSLGASPLCYAVGSAAKG